MWSLRVYVLWHVMQGLLVGSVTQSLLGAIAPGDIVIGILNSAHKNRTDLQSWNRPNVLCTDFDFVSFVQSLAVIQTIETINNSSFLPGIQLGYVMCDSCAFATKALHCVEHMLADNGSLPVLSDYSNFNPPIKVFVGERYSELSIPVAKLLSLYMIPQISCSSSAPTLSDKLRHPSFFRVIPSDVYQTQALAKFMNYFSWHWVGVVTLDDDYGKAALESFLRSADNEHTCVHFQEVLSTTATNEQGLKRVADRIQSSSAKVVLLILRADIVKQLFMEMIKRNISRVWIASDSWSVTRSLMKMPGINKVGDIFGFTFVTGNIPGFEDYLKNLRPSPGARNDFIWEYKQMRFNCTPGQQESNMACNVTNPQDANDDYLLQEVDLSTTYNQRVAVYAIAHAIKTLLNCNNTACVEDSNFLPKKLVDTLKKVNFTLDNQTYYFNENQDFENRYDLIMWKKNGDIRIPEVVGKFNIRNESVDVYEQKISWSDKTVPLSRCSDPCPPGTEKTVLDISCCYNCSSCAEGYYSNQTGELDLCSYQAACQPCPSGTSSLTNSTKCQPLNVWFLKWNDPLPIVVMIATVLGILLLLFSLILFILHRDNPRISNTLLLYCLMKLGLLGSFVSIILFLGDPSDNHCRAQQILYGLGFTLCVSCILVRAFRSFLAVMSYNPNRQLFLSRFNKPFIIMACLTGVQALICLLWFIFDSPKVEEIPSTTQTLTINRQCTQGYDAGFVAMHVYIAILALVCFVFAFKGKDKETEPTVFSMLIHLFVWMCFIALFISQSEQHAIIQISAIMVSNYGVIICHLLPKWYRIISKQVEKSKAKSSSDLDSGMNLQDSFSRGASEASIQTARMTSQTQLVSADTENQTGITNVT